MQKFEVQFDRPFSTIVAAHAKVTSTDMVNEQMRQEALSDQVAKLSELSALASAVKNQLDVMELWAKEQNRLLRVRAVDFSVAIARAVLQMDDELVEKRLIRQVELALEQIEQDVAATLIVNPKDEGAISSWLNENEIVMEVNTSNQVQSGDCRLEWGATGLAAALESQMATIESRLKQELCSS